MANDLRTQAALQAMRKLARFRLDYRWDEHGRVHAILTIALPNGHEVRVSESGDPALILEMIRRNHPDQIGGFLGDIAKGIGKVAKGVATSKVFKAASSVLGTIAPALGPLAPAAMAASTGMKAATYLLAAKQHEALGNFDAIGPLVSAAADVSSSLPALDAAASFAAKVAPRVLPKVTKKQAATAAHKQAVAARKQLTAKAPAAPAATFNAQAFAATSWDVPGSNAEAEAKARAAKAAKEKKAKEKKAKEKKAKAAPLFQYEGGASSSSSSSAASPEQKVYALLLRPAV
jgi:hypothetical protein